MTSVLHCQALASPSWAQTITGSGITSAAVTAFALIDQAIGTLIATGHMDAGQGWAVLQQVSQHTNIKLRHVAELVITWA
ncbi:ANTAR domain-containing protein [Streptomyces sp. NPDC048479]|uniref:ANTAR domain-containing protein n=1 Tax=Streptomyces sp. NPDC048479 TaxID=3154725 RepID=UPI00341D2ADB